MLTPKKMGLIIVVVLALFIGIFKPFANLTPQGHEILAVVFVTLGLWIFRDSTLAYFAGGAILLGGSLAFKLPLATVVSGYTSSGIWVLIPALFFGFALVKTGLGKRIAYFVLKTFEPTYSSVILSWVIIGVALSALTPSITVRLSIVMPIAINLVEACRLPDRSRGSALICLVAWASALLPGTGWLTGSLWGPFMMGFFPAEVKPLVTFGSWFEYMSVPWLLITIFFVILIYVFLKPKEELAISKDTFKEQYAGLGKMSRQEIITGVILTATLILFTTEKLHHIPTTATALLAFFALMIFGVINFPEISTGVNWDIINFFGAALSLQAIFIKSGITSWVRPMIEPSILSMASSPLLFLLVITIGFWVIRFIDIPWGFSTIALTAPLFIPLHTNFGLHPALVAVAVIAAGNSFFLSYQQPFIMIGDAMSKSRGWSPGHVSLGGGIYAVSVIAAIVISSFYWRAMGLMP
ncbi:MAG: anion permease [Deltaproteobacteria bacterium]|nr:anion permease [Deltaproteobacteria bacterium]